MSTIPSDLGKDAERAHDSNTEFFHHVNKAAIDASYIALRTAVLINGGAAVAVLAFLGSLASSNKVQFSQLTHTASSLRLFAWGVASAAFAMVTAYLTNYFITCRIVSQEQTFDYPYLRKNGWTTFWTVLSFICLLLSFTLGVGSVVLFLWGTASISSALIGAVPYPLTLLTH